MPIERPSTLCLLTGLLLDVEIDAEEHNRPEHNRNSGEDWLDPIKVTEVVRARHDHPTTTYATKRIFRNIKRSADDESASVCLLPHTRLIRKTTTTITRISTTIPGITIEASISTSFRASWPLIFTEPGSRQQAEGVLGVA
jgi:hypothetical protein